MSDMLKILRCAHVPAGESQSMATINLRMQLRKCCAHPVLFEQQG